LSAPAYLKLKEVRVNVTADCPDCNGSGLDPTQGECLGCIGHGRTVVELEPSQFAQLLAEAVRA
jgi:DnaJ-class molecular chaperone